MTIHPHSGHTKSIAGLTPAAAAAIAGATSDIDTTTTTTIATTTTNINGGIHLFVVLALLQTLAVILIAFVELVATCESGRN